MNKKNNLQNYLKQNYLTAGKVMKNKETQRQKMGNDLATELLHFSAFFCIFLFHQVCKLMQYNKINQPVTLTCLIFQSGNILLTYWFTQKSG